MPAACAFDAATGLPSVDICERERRAAEPRQPLRAAGARDDAEQHFGLADLGVLRGDPEVAGLRELEPAAERVAVDGRHERLGGVFERA